MNQMLELSKKDFKGTIIKMFQQLIINFPETREKMENLSKETEAIKTQKQITKSKNIIQ